MEKRSPQHGLTRSGRGWVKKINRRTTWICSLTMAPTGADADLVYATKFKDLWTPAPSPKHVLSLAGLCDHFLTRKQRQVDADEMGVRSMNEYRTALQRLCDFQPLPGVKLGNIAAADITPEHLGQFRAAMARAFGPSRLKKFVILIRSVLKYGVGRRWIDPLDLADEFPLPPRRSFRVARKNHDEEHGKKVFTPEECRLLVGGADPKLRAMILLALNGGLGNSDIAMLPRSLMNPPPLFLDYARAKTGIDRRIPLWPETRAAVGDVLVLDRKVASPVYGKYVFLSPTGLLYITDGGKNHRDQIAIEFARLCRGAGLTRDRRGFYSLRRTFRTIADEKGDQRAAAVIMGHDTETDMGGVYVQEISDERLTAVTEYVRSRILTAQ